MEMPIRITREYLNSLPKIKLQPTGDVDCFVRYDKEKNLIYMLDSNGEFTGKLAPADKLIKAENIGANQEPKTAPAVPQAPISPTAPNAAASVPQQSEIPKGVEPFTTDAEEPQEEQRSKPDAEEEIDLEGFLEKPEKKKSWVTPVVIGIAVVAVIAVGIVLGQATKKVRTQMEEQQPSTQSTESAPAETEAVTPEVEGEIEETTQKPEGVTVLAVNKDLLPGHVLTEEDMQTEIIDETDYRLLAGVNGLYTEMDRGVLLGQTIAVYLPMGSYLNYNNVSATYEPVNPWGRTADNEILVPLTVTVGEQAWNDYLWGTEANIKLEVQTKTTTENPGEEGDSENPFPEGVKYSSSVVESMILDTYEIPGAVIVDVQDATGDSLFKRYSALSEIPSGYVAQILASKYPTKESVEGLKPAVIVLAMKEEEANLIRSLNADAMTVIVQEPMPEIQTDLQSEVYRKVQSVGTALMQLLAGYEG